MTGIIRYEPAFPSLFGDAEELFNTFSSCLPSFSKRSSQGYPKIDIINEDNLVLVRATVPGMPKEKINVKIEGEWLIIKGEATSMKNSEKTNSSEIVHKEIKSSRFERTLHIREPEGFDMKNVHAKMENGILEIILPFKKEGLKKPDSYDIKIN